MEENIGNMNKLEKIKKVQDLILDLDLDKEDKFKDIIEIDGYKETRDKEHKYWKELEGKHLIKYDSHNYGEQTIKLITIQKLIYHHNHTWGGNWVDVIVDRLYFSSRNSDVSCYTEPNHMLSSTKVGRYSDYKVLSEEEYITITTQINKFTKEAQVLQHNIHDTFCI